MRDYDMEYHRTAVWRAGRWPSPVETIVIVVTVGFFVGFFLLFGTRHGGSSRMRCGSNLSGMGKAMLLYANDYDDELPRAGGSTSFWGPTAWTAPTRQAAYGLDASGVGGKASVSSSLYLLVKYAEAKPELFVCSEDRGARKWSGEEVDGRQVKFTDCWDFGLNPQTHCSYAYHWPFGRESLTTEREPGVAVAADRNPWIPSPGRSAKPYPWSPDGKHVFQGKFGTSADQLYGNTPVHQEDGQNVLFLDTHVTFEKRASCSLEDDNIYTRSIVPDEGDPLGVPPVFSTSVPSANKKDSVLVHDPPTWPTPVGH